jgi:hypothetical protein
VRKLKKFKRFEKGGLTDSSGNPVLSGDGTPIQTMEDTETPDEKYAKRREGFESIKDFFMGRRSKDEPSAPIEERQPPKKAAEEDKAPTRAAVKPAEPAKTEKIESPRVQSTAVNRGETSYDYPMQRDSKRDDYEGSASPTSGGRTFKRAAPKPVAPKPKPPAPAPAPAAEKTPAAPAKAPRAASPEDIPGTDVKTPYKGETIDNTGLAAKQFAQSTLGATAAGRTLGAGARGAVGLGRMFESLSKPAPKEAPRTEPKLDSKSAPKSAEVSDKPAIDRVKEANIQGPPKPPRQETAADKMGLRETPAMERARQAGEKAAPKPKTATEEMGLRDTPSMVRMRKAKEAAKEGPPAPPKKTSTETPSMERMRKAKESAKEGPPTPPKAKTSAEEMGVRETSAMEKSRKANEGPPDLGARSRRVAAAQKRSDAIPQKDREPGYMQEYIAGREAARNRIKDLPDDGLSTPRYEMKKGGKIPAFKKGGFVSRGDGCAQRGKTKGRMV